MSARRNKVLHRRSPYPPSFNIIPANIIDPPTGASTCALGSQRWAPKIGSLVRKAKLSASHSAGCNVKGDVISVGRWRVRVSSDSHIREISKGILAVIVYIIK